MKFEIIGSGGCVSLPKPLCQCRVCNESRIKGRPYKRYGCSIFFDDLNLLIDTPEDITSAINDSSIRKIDRVMFSHMDPDHVLGFRVIEQLRLNWFDVFEGNECIDPIEVYALPDIMSDLNQIQSKYGPYLDYYDGVRNLISRNAVDFLEIEDVRIDLIQVGNATIFVFQEKDKKVIYAPCDVKPFPENEIFKGADVLIIGNTFIGEVLKDGYRLSEDNPLRDELFSMEEIAQLKSDLKIKEVIMTHLEEDWGKSYDDYLELEKSYENIKFAYDGMILEI